jgi:hypothetical protein
MTTDRKEGNSSKTTTKKTLATAKEAAKPVLKPASRKAVAMPKPAAKKTKKATKVEMVRDSFSMPKTEYRKIAEIKEACLKAGLHVKKSAVLLAGLKVLGEMNAAQLKRAMAGLEKVKTAHPKKP